MAEIRKYRPGVQGAVAEAIARAVAEGIQPAGAAAPPKPGDEPDELDDLEDEYWEDDDDIDPPAPVTPPKGFQVGRVRASGSSASVLPGSGVPTWGSFVVPAPKKSTD